MTASNYSVTIAGSPVNVEAGTLDLTNQIGQRSQGSMTVWTATGVVFNYGAGVVVKDGGGNTVYTGFVVEDQVSKPGKSAILEHALTVVDNHYLADKRLAALSWLNTTAGQIVTDLWTNYLQPEGVLLGAVAAGVFVPEYVANYEAVSTQLDNVASMSGYWWQIDETRTLMFQPYGALTSPFTLDGSQVDQTKQLTVTVGNKDYRNRQYGVGGKDQTGLLTETLHGDGIKRAFTLRYPVATIAGKDKATGSVRGIYVNGVLQTAANKSTGNGAQWYFAVSDSVLAQDVGQTVLGSGDTLSVTYNGEYPVVALAQNAALITAQQALEGIGTGYVEARYSNRKVHTLDAMFTIAQAQLSHYGQTMTTLTFSTMTAGIVQGQSLLVNLPDFGLSNRVMLVESVEITDNVDNFNIWYVVTCVGSPYDVAQWQTFWAQLLTNNNAADDQADNQSDGSALAEISQSTASWGWHGSTTDTIHVCLICGPSTLCGPAQYVC